MANEYQHANKLALNLFDKHKEDIKRMLRKNSDLETAEFIDDFMQDLYLQLVILYELDKMQGVKDERLYLFRMAKNGWIKQQQRRTKNAEDEKAYTQDIETWEEENPYALEEFEQTMQAVRSAIAGIKPKRRKDILFLYASGKTMKEIAEMTGLNTNIVKRQLQLARDAIKRSTKNNS